MTMYSYSRISCFNNCPLQFRFRYIDRKKPDFKNSIEAFLGSTVHNTLELLHTEKQIGKILTIDYLLDNYTTTWKDSWSDDIRIVKTENKPEFYFLRGIKFVEDYYNKYQPFNQGDDIGIEEKVFINLNGKYNMIGYIDRLTKLDGNIYEIHDYKTGAYLPAQDTLDADHQLAIYMLAVLNKFPDAKNVELVWHYLAFDKELRSNRTITQLDNLKLEIINKINLIESAKDYPPKESALCRWCAYQSHCPLRGPQKQLNLYSS